MLINNSKLRIILSSSLSSLLSIRTQMERIPQPLLLQSPLQSKSKIFTNNNTNCFTKVISKHHQNFQYETTAQCSTPTPSPSSSILLFLSLLLFTTAGVVSLVLNTIKYSIFLLMYSFYYYVKEVIIIINTNNNRCHHHLHWLPPFAVCYSTQSSPTLHQLHTYLIDHHGQVLGNNRYVTTLTTTITTTTTATPSITIDGDFNIKSKTKNKHKRKTTITKKTKEKQKGEVKLLSNESSIYCTIYCPDYTNLRSKSSKILIDNSRSSSSTSPSPPLSVDGDGPKKTTITITPSMKVKTAKTTSPSLSSYNRFFYYYYLSRSRSFFSQSWSWLLWWSYYNIYRSVIVYILLYSLFSCSSPSTSSFFLLSSSKPTSWSTVTASIVLGPTHYSGK